MVVHAYKIVDENQEDLKGMVVLFDRKIGKKTIDGSDIEFIGVFKLTPNDK